MEEGADAVDGGGVGVVEAPETLPCETEKGPSAAQAGGKGRRRRGKGRRRVGRGEEVGDLDQVAWFF